jgi:hypothetical protein
LNEEGIGRDVIGVQTVGAARLLTTLANTKRPYLIPTEAGKICLVLEGGNEACTDPLTASTPAMVVTVDADGPGGTGPLVFGVAMDGVRAVSFSATDSRSVVPVVDNVFSIQGDSAMTAASVSEPTATFDDGRVVPIP